MIGTLGTKIVFEVSAEQVLTFESLSREVAGRWAAHEILGAKPKTEYLGPAAQTASLTIRLSAALGVKPRTMLETVEEMSDETFSEIIDMMNSNQLADMKYILALHYPQKTQSTSLLVDTLLSLPSRESQAVFLATLIDTVTKSTKENIKESIDSL